MAKFDCEAYKNAVINALTNANSVASYIGITYPRLRDEVDALYPALEEGTACIANGRYTDARCKLSSILPAVKKLGSNILEEAFHRTILKNAMGNISVSAQNGLDFVQKYCEKARCQMDKRPTDPGSSSIPERPRTLNMGRDKSPQPSLVEDVPTNEFWHNVDLCVPPSMYEEDGVGRKVKVDRFVANHDLLYRACRDATWAAYLTDQYDAYEASTDLFLEINALYEFIFDDVARGDGFVSKTIQKTKPFCNVIYMPKFSSWLELDAVIGKFFKKLLSIQHPPIKHIWAYDHPDCKYCRCLLPHCYDECCTHPFCFKCMPLLASRLAEPVLLSNDYQVAIETISVLIPRADVVIRNAIFKLSKIPDESAARLEESRSSLLEKLGVKVPF